MGTATSRIEALEAAAEAAYAAMYDAPTASSATARYSDAKENLHDAIGLARQSGFAEIETRLRARLEEIKIVFRTQFPG